MRSELDWQKGDWLAVGEHECMSYVKTKFHGYEVVNLSNQETAHSNINQFLEALKKLDCSFQGKRRNRIYYSTKASRRSRARTGQRLGTAGLILMNGKSLPCEKFFSGEPFDQIVEVTFDFARRRQTLVRLKGDKNEYIRSVR